MTILGPSRVEVLLFTKRLAVMVRAGVPLPEAIASLRKQGSVPSLDGILQDMEKQVANGQSFAAALHRHPRVFSRLYIALIEMSEQSGTLDSNLEYIATQLGKAYSLQAKIRNALLYPSLLVIATIGMAAFIVIAVLPNLVSFFTALDIELPLSTRILLGISMILRTQWVSVGLILATIIGLWRGALLVPAMHRAWDYAFLHFPLIGRFSHTAALAQMTRTLGVLLQHGVPTATALEITMDVITNTALRYRMATVLAKLEQGTSVATAMQQYTWAFQPIVITMISVGEQTGNLGESLLYLADFYEEDIDAQSKNITTILEPVMLLIIGIVVAFVALSIITPIYQLTGSIRR